MRAAWVLCLAAVLQAQDEPRVIAYEAMTPEACRKLAEGVKPRIAAYTRLRFRRPVPIRVLSKDEWDVGRKSADAQGLKYELSVAFYRPRENDVFVVPWNFKGERTRAGWMEYLEPTLAHELTHAIHHQNFYTPGHAAAATAMAKPAESEVDRATVHFLMGEGLCELVALRTSSEESRAAGGVFRMPRRETDSLRTYMKRYRAQGRRPFYERLSEYGYQDGLTLMHHFVMKAGMRGVRAILYRPPPRELFFQPAVLAKLPLSEPPDCDTIFRFLHPGPFAGEGVLLACNPGEGRNFEKAAAATTRAPGCLVGYTAAAGGNRYSIFVADPDAPGEWSAKQAEGLARLGKVERKKVALPMQDGVEADVMTVEGGYVRAEVSGLVVLVHAPKPSPTLEKRVLFALRTLYAKRPLPGLYRR